MMSPKLHRNVTTFARISAGLISGASLAFFIVILVKVLDGRFPATGEGYSALPVAALAAATVWDIVALVTLGWMHRFAQAAGDIVATLLLVILGSVSFAHDDKAYLSNGMYLQYNNDQWLYQAKVGGSLALIAILLQIMLAVLCFYVPKQKKQIEGVQPPPYLENQQLVKDKDLEADCRSLQYTESQYSVDKPEDPEKDQVVEKEDAKKKAADV